jgi:LPXTG-motif cell wall-anchored protein
MRFVPALVGILLVAGGAVWMAQGLNLPFAPRSFMTREPTWILIGALAVVGGLALLARSRRRD